MRTTSRLMLIVVGALLILSLVAILKRPGGRKEVAVQMLDPAKIIVLRTPGGMLEVATLRKVEEYAWQVKYECPLIDCTIILKPTISRVRVPVSYVYRVPLAETWELRLNGDHYELTVPALHPASPVALDTSKLEIESSRGWISPSQRGNEQALMRQLGPELDRRAGHDTNLSAVRSAAETTIQEFAKKWMREQSKDGKKPIRVLFRYTP